MAEGDGYDNRLSLNRDQFTEALSVILNKGSKHEYGELFDKVDVTKEGVVDWDKFASHMLLDFYERDDKVKSTQVPQWKGLRPLPSSHKEVIQRVTFLKTSNRYISISKEGCVSMWSQNLKIQRVIKTGSEACRARDLWVTDFVILPNINKIALSFTSKEIAFYDLSSKLDFNCQYKVIQLHGTPLCMDYWYNPENVNEAVLVWGDVTGAVNAIHFSQASITLFERPPAPPGEKQEPCLTVILSDISAMKYKNVRYTKHEGHTEWVRQVNYCPQLECFISCATTWNNSLVIGWLEKHSSVIKASMRATVFQITQGVNAFDYHENLNLIATAGVNHHVCLWNPYVVSKPNGVLRGHMASVISVKFNPSRGQLISFSKDKVLRIWDVQLQVCIQRLAGMFPKGPEVISTLFFHEDKNRLFITFNNQLTCLEMKTEVRDRVLSHEKPVVAALYNSTYNQVVSVCQGGTVTVWMADTGQKVKQFSGTHGNAEVTYLTQDHSETRIYTASTDGTVKIWDFNGHCYQTLECAGGDPCELGQVIVLKRSLLVIGWTRYITVFRPPFRDFHVEPADWKGGQEHQDDILAVAFSPPHTLATGSYDGEIIIWNTNSEVASRRLSHRSRHNNQSKRAIQTLPESSEIGGFDSYTYLTDNPAVRPKSRVASRISTGSNDEQNEFGFAIARLIFLNSRKGSSGNLVSCGGNGWVRLWNTSTSSLLAEFVAHTQVGSVIMAIDETDEYLVTGDVDGLVKVWDISEYCLYHTSAEPVLTPPPLKAQWQPHVDIINSIEIFERNDRILVLTSSSDCSVALYDIDGKLIGIFGQEDHWKIEDLSSILAEQQENKPEEDGNKTDVNEETESELETYWEPDKTATSNPKQYRVNTWNNTCLGKSYQEYHSNKRERRQPEIIPDLPYVHQDRSVAPPVGPYSALTTLELSNISALKKPDFMFYPEKYFSEETEKSIGVIPPIERRIPFLAENGATSTSSAAAAKYQSFDKWLAGPLKAAFDEKSLFPKYILDFESKMKSYHQSAIQQTKQVKMSGASAVTIVTPSQQQGNQSPSRRKPIRLKPIVKLAVKDSD
ncbi:cilia- and flagella-associated protein 337-like isoform X2 [Tubulanus polymorphus]|uniref:cilia- and flagella-associated protein 337-like isoform X2 n=1 Tax=Tubulanus polymorphus TaxID=672921 RepID=UPI003DA38F4F